MECLNVLFENEGIQNYVSEKEEDILAGANMFHEYPQVVKDHIMENLDDFLGETIEETHQNIVEFTASSAFQYLGEIVEMIDNPSN
jgi:hypothetical protein